MVVDSDILVDFFRDFEAAREFLLNSQETLNVSRVTVMEILIGVKTKQAAIKALKQLDVFGIEVIEINQTISVLAADIFWKARYRYGIGILDTFVAATAIVLGEKLVSRNIKHYQVIRELVMVPY